MGGLGFAGWGCVELVCEWIETGTRLQGAAAAGAELGKPLPLVLPLGVGSKVVKVDTTALQAHRRRKPSLGTAGAAVALGSLGLGQEAAVSSPIEVSLASRSRSKQLGEGRIRVGLF